MGASLADPPPNRRPLLFAAGSAGGRLRRPADALLVVPAALLVAVTAAVAANSQESEAELVDAAATLLGDFNAAWRLAYLLALGYGGTIVVVTLVARRWRLARDLLVAVGGVLAVSLLVDRAVSSDWLSMASGIWTTSDEYPAFRLAAVVVVVTVAGPELTRGALLGALWLTLFAAIGAVVLAIAYPSSVLGGIALGVGVGRLVRSLFGSTAGFPGPARVRAGLGELGVATDSPQVATKQRSGAATYAAVDGDGRALTVVVLGRDAQDTQRLVNTWRNLAYRNSAPDLATGRLHQVEHESLVTLLAERAGVNAPGVRVAGLVDSGDALLVMIQPDGPTVEDTDALLDDDFLGSLWGQAARLRQARLAHGALNLSNVMNTPSGPMIVSFQRGQIAAPPQVLDVDVAELLVATSIAAGPERALKAALDAVGPDAVAGALPFLQRAALTPHLRDRAAQHELRLKDLRERAAAATEVSLPQIAPMRRVTLRDFLVMALVAIAAYGIVSQLADIGFRTIYDQLHQAEWAWVALALLAAQLTFVTQAVSTRGAVRTPLPLSPVVALHSALKFIGLTVPSDAGRIAVSVRFLQRQGVSTGEAVGAGAVDSISDTIVQIAVVLLVLPFVDLDAELPSVRGGGSRALWLLAVLVVVVAGVVAAVLAVPAWRDRVLPMVRDALSGVRTVSRQRSKRLQLFGGSLATQVLYALALGAACHAYGLDLDLGQLLLVNTAATVFAAIVPVPGGIGVAEAGITAGLVAVGVPESAAFAVALTHRFCSHYLPPIWGYVALRWLNRKGYL